MIDLHTHILPAVDDGARDLAEAAAMCRMAADDGCHTLVATPHMRHESWWNDDLETLEELRQDLQDHIGRRPRLLLGGEIRVDSGLLEEVDRLPGGQLATLGGARYLLLEFDRLGLTVDPELIVHEVSVEGWRPILAHPEFIPWLASDLHLVERLVESGALLQVTAMSVTGDLGRGPRETTHALLDAGFVHFVASDCHSVDWRPPGLRRAREEIANRWGKKVAELLTVENPQAVLEDEDVRMIA